MSGRKFSEKPISRQAMLAKIAKRHKASVSGGLQTTNRGYLIPICSSCGIPCNWTYKSRFFCAICNKLLRGWTGRAI